jgi:hypothetical protein
MAVKSFFAAFSRVVNPAMNLAIPLTLNAAVGIQISTAKTQRRQEKQRFESKLR